MREGTVLERGATQQVLADPQHPYTQTLCAISARNHGLIAALYKPVDSQLARRLQVSFDPSLRCGRVAGLGLVEVVRGVSERREP